MRCLFAYMILHLEHIKADNILNTKKDWFSCKVNIEVNGKDYWIQRHAKKTKER